MNDQKKVTCSTTKLDALIDFLKIWKAGEIENREQTEEERKDILSITKLIDGEYTEYGKIKDSQLGKFEDIVSNIITY